MSSKAQEVSVDEYREVLESKVFPRTMYEVQRKYGGVWERITFHEDGKEVALIRGRQRAYGKMAEARRQSPEGTFRVIRQDQADHYREGLAARAPSRSRRPLMYLPERL